jgi:hypothetical protein
VIVRIFNQSRSAYESREVYRHGRPSGRISAAVMDARGKLLMECVLETKLSKVLLAQV